MFGGDEALASNDGAEQDYDSGIPADFILKQEEVG